MAFLGFGVSRVLKAVAASGVVMGVLAMAAVPPGAFAGSGEPAHKLLKKSSKQASAPVKQNWSSGGNTAGGKATTETAVLSGQATTPFITADSTDKMQAVLSHYEQIVSAGGWPSVPSAKFKKAPRTRASSRSIRGSSLKAISARREPKASLPTPILLPRPTP